MVELVDTPDLGSGAVRCGGSSPLLGTSSEIFPKIAVFIEQRKIHLAILTLLMASSASLIGGHAKEEGDLLPCLSEHLPEEVVSPWAMSYVKTVTRDYFASNLENIQVKPLAGGHSASANVQLEIAGKAYVLRVISELESPPSRNKELYAMKEAAAIGVGPAILWISPDGYGILMDYVAGGTLTIETGKRPETTLKIADLLRKVHALQKNPFCAPSFEAQMEEFYQQYSQRDSNHAIWEEAISIIKEGALQLQSLNAPTVNTHGDLNPRNILVSDQDLCFIDWGDGTYTDPFQDLAFFSIMMDYDLKEEIYLMDSYLGHAPTVNERKRFQIAKKMNFARLVLSGQDIGNRLGSNQKDNYYIFEPIREWSYYAKTFANDHTPLSAEFFWGLAQVALEAARSLDAETLFTTQTLQGLAKCFRYEVATKARVVPLPRRYAK
jgi:aminoglycoside phosphotransferase (APT) family kinase protein